MNKLKLIITDRAKEDITTITDYIAQDNKKAAKAMSAYLYKICSDLAMFPNMGISRPDFTYKDFKFYTIKNHYIIVYRVSDNNLYISNLILHLDLILIVFF